MIYNIYRAALMPITSNIFVTLEAGDHARCPTVDCTFNNGWDKKNRLSGVLAHGKIEVVYCPYCRNLLEIKSESGNLN